MKERKKLITENTKININEDIIKEKVQELFWEMFVEFVNTKFEHPVLRLK